MDGRGLRHWEQVESFLQYGQDKRLAANLATGRYLKDVWDHYREWMKSWNKQNQEQA